jgi:acyl carrier protein
MTENASLQRSPAPPTDNSGLRREVADLIVQALNLTVAGDEIDPQGPLYGGGLGLDSIDILEIALEISKAYGFQLRSDDSDNVKIFSSLRSLSEHVQRSRTK